VYLSCNFILKKVLPKYIVTVALFDSSVFLRVDTEKIITKIILKIITTTIIIIIIIAIITTIIII
jgi:hypothetical protein